VWEEIILHSPLFNLLQIVFMLTVGWMPGYLFFNATGPQKYKGKVNDHFNPFSALFSPRERLDIVWSDIGLVAALAGMVYCVKLFGFRNVAFFYLLPYMVVNYHLVLITYLQHTDIYVPHFRNKVSKITSYHHAHYISIQARMIMDDEKSILTTFMTDGHVCHVWKIGMELAARCSVHGG